MKLDKHSWLYVLLLAISVGACSKGPVEIDSLKGKPESELIKEWGNPDLAAPFQYGGKVHTWITQEQDDYGAYTCRKSVTVDQTGTIVKAMLSGCPSRFGNSQQQPQYESEGFE